jgi:SnoaL-like domain
MGPPLAVATLLEALGEGRVNDAAGAFEDDALYAYPNGDDETAERSTARGRDAIRRALAARSPEHPEPIVCVQAGSDCFVEGRVVAATFVVSVQLGADGAIARLLSFRPTLDRYFRHLTAGEFAAACACFSEDCLYSHPPYSPGAPRAEFRGRGELLAGFEQTRGVRPARPEIVCCLQRGSECFIEGVVGGIENGGSFVSSVSLDRDGLIRRYAAFYSKSRVPRRGG